MTGLNIDLVKILLLLNVLSVYKDFFESSQGCLNLRTPSTSTELSVNLIDSISLNFLDSRAKMYIHLYEEFLCQYKFQLSLPFPRQNKDLETKSRRSVCFSFIFNINAQIVQYLIALTFEVPVICSFRFFGPASARSYKIGAVGNNWFIGW